MIHFELTHTQQELDLPVAVIVEILEASMRELNKAVSILETSYAAKDHSAIKSIAHKIHGMSMTIRLEELSGLTASIQQMEPEEILSSPIVQQTVEEIRYTQSLISKHLP
ncbi:Hpt domain-containing protein [Chitinophaga dinghuensis]|uniref:Hpt domain-containing protein n=1 Tax=Chitinophaga dinghuensis TaxID=1539050 RepID=A0A327VPY8_9BACT|nr:Hpt domain-containing protein [Chitinophaga dinghuensis]RAJ77405.1 Hpt domain-containing protein [Chitinophaga dinghuensis]